MSRDKSSSGEPFKPSTYFPKSMNFNKSKSVKTNYFTTAIVTPTEARTIILTLFLESKVISWFHLHYSFVIFH